MTIARYDVNNANVNRHVRFKVEAAAAADRDTGIFLALKGDSNQYPFYGQITSPTGLQEVAQLRLSLVVRALSQYTVPVSVQVSDDSAGTGEGSAVDITFEADEFGAYFNQTGFTTGTSWPLNTTLDKHITGDITDTLGTGGMTTVKTKNGLQSLLDTLGTVSFDGGTTGPFGDLSNGGTVVLRDGTSVTGVPVLDNGGGGATTPSGLTIAFVNVG